ncbi:hypothetical protein LSAT2_029636, partial [Lamellibrachia satsuma]
SVGLEMEIESAPGPAEENSSTTTSEQANYASSSTKSTQCDTPERLFCIYKFVDKPNMIHYYTSFEDYENFMFFFNILGPASAH